SHRHGRSRGRPELEAAAQPSDPGEPASDQQDPARLRRSPARRERPANRRGDSDEVAMMLRATGLVLAMCVAAAPGCAQELVLEPEGYRVDEYRAPVPETLTGARVITTAEAETIWRAKNGIFLDVLPRAPKPSNLPAGTIWRDRPRF